MTGARPGHGLCCRGRGHRQAVGFAMCMRSVICVQQAEQQRTSKLQRPTRVCCTSQALCVLGQYFTAQGSRLQLENLVCVYTNELVISIRPWQSDEQNTGQQRSKGSGEHLHTGHVAQKPPSGHTSPSCAAGCVPCSGM